MLNSESLKYIVSVLIMFFAFSRVNILLDSNAYLDFAIISAITDSLDASISIAWLVTGIEILLCGLFFFKDKKWMLIIILFYGAGLLITIIEIMFIEYKTYSVMTEKIYISIGLRLAIILSAYGYLYVEKHSKE